MPSIDALPPDQRAVLELVLRRGRTYDEIAQLLSIDRAGVRQRALAALDALGPDADVPAERRALITDYLLGALPPRVADQVRDRLAQTPAERAWARVIATELEPITSRALPEIPADAGAARAQPAPPPPGPEPEPERPEPPARREPRRRERGATAESEEPGRRRPGRRERRPGGRRGRLGPGTRLEPGRERPPSRRGGKLVLLAAAVIVLIVVLSIVLSGGSSKGGHTTPHTGTAGTTPTTASTPATSTTGSTPTTSTTGQAAKIVAQVNLNPPSGGSAKGVAEILKAGSTQAVAIVATHVAPNKAHDAYAVWVYNSPSDAFRLGFVSPGVGSSGKLQTEGPLPANASHFHHLIVTLESSPNPKTPGQIVLEGDLTGVS